MINECKTQTILVGHRVTVPSSHPSPLRQLTSACHSPETDRRRKQQSHDPTLRVRWNLARYTTRPSRLLGAKNSQQRASCKTSAEPPENYICMQYPSLSGGQASASGKGNDRQLLEQKKTWAWQPELRWC